MTSEAYAAAFTSHANTYTEAEKAKLLEFRNVIADLTLTEEQLEDSFLIKWLRARYLDLPKAEEMLRASMKWRKDNGIDTILERGEIQLPPEMKNWPMAFCGLSKEGYGVFIAPFGRHDQRAVLEKYGIEACEKFNMVFFEMFTKQMQDEGKKHGVNVTQVIDIWDCEGYSYRQMATKQCREFMARMQASMDANYPEILRYAMIINAPKIFAIIFNMLKPVIPKATLEKIDIFGPDPAKWKAVVADKFPIEMMPPQ